MQWILCFAVALIISAAGVVQLFLPRTSHLVDAGTSARFRRMAASVFAAATVLSKSSFADSGCCISVECAPVSATILLIAPGLSRTGHGRSILFENG